jgi:protein transport protein SEC24
VLTRPRPSQAGIEALKPTGGKLHAFITSLPNVGAHALKPRTPPVTVGEKGEKEKLVVLQPQTHSLKSVAMGAADYQVGCMPKII